MLRRIVKHAEYQSFLNAVRSCRLPHFFVPVLAEEDDGFAFGITTMSKIGKAVRRNRLKRRLKAWFHDNQEILPQGLKINLIAKQGATDLEWAEVCREMSELITLLKNEN